MHPTNPEPVPSMKGLYSSIMRYANHRHSLLIVNFISFIESSFFPIAPDLLMIPMILANRQRAWVIAFTCTISSVLGGILGYVIGYYLFNSLGEWIFDLYNFKPYLNKFIESFREWGFWIIVGKGLTPIPYKVVTIASGFAQINFITFILASCIARAFRFFLLAGGLFYFGPWAKDFIEKYFMLVLISSLGIIVAGYFLIKYLVH